MDRQKYFNFCTRVTHYGRFSFDKTDFFFLTPSRRAKNGDLRASGHITGVLRELVGSALSPLSRTQYPNASRIIPYRSFAEDTESIKSSANAIPRNSTFIEKESSVTMQNTMPAGFVLHPSIMDKVQIILMDKIGICRQRIP